MADPLATLLRLRRLAREAAMQSLAAALHRQAARARELETLRLALRREIGAAPFDAGHPLAGFLPRWADHTRALIADATTRQAAAAHEVADAQQALLRAEAAMAASEALRGSRLEAARRRACRRAQQAMDDDSASRRFSRAEPPSGGCDPCR